MILGCNFFNQFKRILWVKNSTTTDSAFSSIVQQAPPALHLRFHFRGSFDLHTWVGTFVKQFQVELRIKCASDLSSFGPKKFQDFLPHFFSHWYSASLYHPSWKTCRMLVYHPADFTFKKRAQFENFIELVCFQIPLPQFSLSNRVHFLNLIAFRFAKNFFEGLLASSILFCTKFYLLFFQGTWVQPAKKDYEREWNFGWFCIHSCKLEFLFG